MSDDAASSSSSAKASTAAIHAAVAAKLRRAGSLESSGSGSGSSSSNKRPNRSSAGSGSSSITSSGSATVAATSSIAAVGTGASASSSGGGARKLLHWSPAQWASFEAAPTFATVVASAKILPIRTPMSSLYEIHYADEHANYTPSALMEKLLAASRSGPVINVGLVIDASGTDYFLHDVKEWEDWDVKFFKLGVALPAVESGTETDTDAIALRKAAEDAMATAFFQQVEKHNQSERKDMEIAVFGGGGGSGTTGYNFVGFLVVSYLIEYCSLSLDAALKEYAASSPPGIYSRYFLELLYRKYFSTLPSSASTVKCPPPPKWETTESSRPESSAGGNDNVAQKIGASILTEDDQLHKFVRKMTKTLPRVSSAAAAMTPTGGSSSSSSSSILTPTNRDAPSTPSAPTYKPPLYIPPDREAINTRPAKRRKIRSWMDDVEPLEFGETLDASSEEHTKVLAALETLTANDGFPGCEAIPLTATHVGADAHKKRGCLTNAYFVTWRARGRRCLLFVSEYGTYIVSRNMTFTKVTMKFPRRRALNESQVNTLIDGIIVEDQDHDHKVARYLAFDIAFLEGSPIWQKKLEKRLQCLQNEIILPRKNDQTFDYATEPFRVRMKDHFKLSKTEYMLTKFVHDVTHEVDGVIFTPLEAPYNLGGFEADAPIFKFVASEGSGIPGLDGSLPQRRLLEYIQSCPPK